MKTWKKNLMAAAVLVTVCAGIYLNWLYAEDQATADLTDKLDSSKILSSDMLVMSDSSLEDTVNTATDYFAAVRLSRQEARDSAVSLLQEAMSYSNEEAAAQSNEDLEEIMSAANGNWFNWFYSAEKLATVHPIDFTLHGDNFYGEG